MRNCSTQFLTSFVLGSSLGKEERNYDTIVVGGGHAGTEAAAVLSRMGHKTLLLTHSKKSIGQMSCNPAIGGVGKGHLTKEIDALGGLMARAADIAGIHLKTLNASKGKAVQATRAQADRSLYRQAIQAQLREHTNLSLAEGAASRVLLEGGVLRGVETESGERYFSKKLVLTVGTFLNGVIHTGREQISGGRKGDRPSIVLAKQLLEISPRTGRLKTGTPPRLLRSSINFGVLQEQAGDDPRPVFSFMSSRADHPEQVSCYITHTNEETHNIIRDSLKNSPLHTGAIEGVGPRYCPSIEDKVVKFSEKSRHQIFVEPEGLDSNEVYPNGISTSIEAKKQEEFVRSIVGFESAEITQSGYAIEYDYFDPRDLNPTFETKAITGLYFAGQINGTTGYEEAAAQGLIAGINAGLAIKEKHPWVPERSEAYLGVLSSDLITRGTSEPYRMFTSRAEHRLLLREDNADQRLTPIGKKLGIVSEDRWKAFNLKTEIFNKEKKRLSQIQIKASDIEGLGQTQQKDNNKKPAHSFLKRPGVSYSSITKTVGVRSGYNKEPELIKESVDTLIETEAKYEGYVNKQKREIEKQKTNSKAKLPSDIDYSSMPGLSNEIKQKLTEFAPKTIGHAARIEGVTPASLSVLLVHLKKQKMKKAEGL